MAKSDEMDTVQAAAGHPGWIVCRGRRGETVWFAPNWEIKSVGLDPKDPGITLVSLKGYYYSCRTSVENVMAAIAEARRALMNFDWARSQANKLDRPPGMIGT
jgi:hypothetical protein